MSEEAGSAIPEKRAKILTEEEKDVIEKNRKAALELRKSKVVAASSTIEIKTSLNKSNVNMHGTKFIDTGAGFLMEEKQNDPYHIPDEILAEFDELELPVNYRDCMECKEKFAVSYLWDSFAYSVCDACRDPDEKHSLITRTEAKQEYLLKDCDLDKREPLLKFISRANPHNVRWGQMKLYLHIQIEERALEVWGSEENLVREHELRNSKREQTKVKKYNKQLKQLRMNVRSSLYDKTKAASHEHEYVDETLIEDDTYSHRCAICGFEETFEKM